MKATAAAAPPMGAEWVHEVKWDGMRVLLRCVDGETTLASSNGIDATVRFPELTDIGRAIGCDAVLDGEVIAVDAAGRPDFGTLQRRMHLSSPTDVKRVAADVPVALALFDILWLDGHDLCPLPWEGRRGALEQIVEPAPSWRVPPTDDDGPGLLAIADEQGLEGIVSKRIDSTYLPGKRTTSWRKVKVRRHQEFVVGGWWPGEKGRAGQMGSLLIGVHDPSTSGNPLRFAGKVGTGFTAPVLASYDALLAELASDECPFDPPPPRAIAAKAHWVRPEIVVEVSFGEWTTEGVLRHPSHLGRRDDKAPQEVIREPYL
jgi:bifunctional non-homologous end joining protein LigD